MRVCVVFTRYSEVGTDAWSAPAGHDGSSSAAAPATATHDAPTGPSAPEAPAGGPPAHAVPLAHAAGATG